MGAVLLLSLISLRLDRALDFSGLLHARVFMSATRFNNTYIDLTAARALYGGALPLCLLAVSAGLDLGGARGRPRPLTRVCKHAVWPALTLLAMPLLGIGGLRLPSCCFSPRRPVRP